MFRSHVLKELSAYLDDQLSRRKKEKVEKHLADCKNCREELSRLKQISEQLKAWQTPDLGADFDARVKHQIVLGELEKGEVKMNKKLIPQWIPASALVIILLGVVISLQTYSKRGLQGSIRDARVTVAGFGQRGWEGKLKSAADDMGEQFDPAKYAVNLTLSGAQHEPYYVQNDRVALNEVNKHKGTESVAKWSGSADATRNMLAAGSDAYETGDEPADTGEGSVIVIYPVLPVTSEGEKVIRNAAMTLEVPDGREAYKKASQICQELGGYLTFSKFYRDNEGREAGTIIMRIPKEKFNLVQDQLSTLGKVEAINTSSRDVTLEYNSLKTQLDSAKVILDRMLETFKKKPVTVPDAIRQESELNPIRSRIESLTSRITQLDNSVSFTTITLGFHEPKISEKTLSESRNIIKESMITAKINFIKFLANAIPQVLVTAILVIAGLVVFFLVKPLISRLFKKE
jgi:hypothetical protein